MSDAQLRTLERRAQTSGTPADAGAWRAAQVRAGELTSSQLSLLAHLGDRGALTALGLPTPPDDAPLEEAIVWLRGLTRWGVEVLYRGVFAWLQHAARDGPPEMRAAFQRALDDRSAVDSYALRSAHGDEQRLRLVASHSSWLVLEAQQHDPPRASSILSVLDRLFEDVERGALTPPPPRAEVRARLDAPAVLALAVESVAAGETTPDRQRRMRQHFLDHGPGTYRILTGDLDVHQFVVHCGFESARVRDGCFETFRGLAGVTAFAYLGPGEPDGWSVSP